MKLPATLKRFAAKIHDVDDDTYNANGYWVYLNDGWKNGDDPMGTNHTIHEETLKECASKLSMVMPCDCVDCAKTTARS
jgi:hypothetical protein